MADMGPVSVALEQELRGKFAQNRPVVWLDKGASYNGFVDNLIRRFGNGDFPVPVVAFRGSFLELLLRLDEHAAAPDRHLVLVHMPGFNDDSIRKTPVLELYEAGVCFQRALDTLVREAAMSRVPPAEVERFLTQAPTMEDADAWLAAVVAQGSVGLAAVLNDIGQAMFVEAAGKDDSSLAARIKTPEDVVALRSYLHKLTGVDDEWIEWFVAVKGHATPLKELLAATTAWLLCVEYVHDLRRPPHLPSLARLKALSGPVVKRCGEILAAFRRDHADAYELIALEVEGFVAEELAKMSPDDLGQIDTFREEENKILDGAVAALGQKDWTKVRGWCDARRGDASFWLTRDPSRRFAWNLVEEAALFGETLSKYPAPLAGAASLEEVARRYVDGAYDVDRAHRRFEQKRLVLLEPRLPHFGALQEVVSTLRQAHRRWADELTRAFGAVCTEHGFLPPDTLQQRNVFDQVVHPIAASGEKVAVFVIDALRYEMATELKEEMDGAGGVVDLKARFAELPTITSVGMNALAPVAKGGRLAVAGALDGFKTGEFTVRTPEHRARAMGVRSTGKAATLLQLAEICDMTTQALTKKVRDAGMMVVHSKEIDDAGEANVGLPTFDSTLRQIKSAWRHLQLAGVKNFVFTADHGFLIQDETTQQRRFGTTRTPKRRHVLEDTQRPEAGLLNVSLSSLGYDGLDGYLVFRDDTAVFDNGNPGATFVHGGNSLQERIIPVLVVTKKRVEATGVTEYTVEAESMTSVLGHHRLRVRVKLASQRTLAFAAVRTVDLAVRAVDGPDVRSVLKEASGAGEVRGGRLRVPIGDDWTEVFFGLEGPSDGRSRIEVHHPDAVERVSPVKLEVWLAVSGTSILPKGGAKSPSTPPAALSSDALAVPASGPAPAGLPWADTIQDEGVRKVFLHIEKHGAITEVEVTQMLGSPRKFRVFSLEFDQYLAKLPFRVETQIGEGGKRYVRGDR